MIAISLLALTRFYPFAGIVPLLPVFALATHYFASGTRTRAEQKNTLLFCVYSMVPLLVYLVALYELVDLMPLQWALICASALWCLPTTLLLILWMKFHADTSTAV